MSRPAVALLLLCALLACKKEPPPPAPVDTTKRAPVVEEQQPAPDTDVENALNLVYGASVVFRGGENDLENSAVHALDGFLDTTWTSAPGSPEETIIYSFLAKRHIERVGATVVKNFAPDSVAFDASMDGKTWTELTKMKLENSDQQQLVDVKPTDARYLRVRTFDAANKYYVRVRAFQAMGQELEPPRMPSFGGCWTINGVRARLEQSGARITGVIETEPPIHLDGGTSDNRLGMVMWMQGGTRGEAVLTRSGDGKQITGLRFYEDVDSSNMGEGWFGERCTDPRLGAGGTAAPQAFLARAKRYSLYGLAFDRNDRLIAEVSAPSLDTLESLLASSSQRMSIVAHEVRYATPEQNKQHAAARLQALRAALQARGVDLRRIDFIAAGSDRNGSSLSSVLQQTALSRVDLIFGT